MRMYIFFVFPFICLFFCVCVNLIFVKDFSETAAPKILKFGTNVGYDFNIVLYSVKENQPAPAYHSLYLSIFLSLQ